MAKRFTAMPGRGYLALLKAATRQFTAAIGLGSALLVVLANFVSATSGIASYFGRTDESTASFQAPMGVANSILLAAIAAVTLSILLMTWANGKTPANRPLNLISALGFPANISGQNNQLPGSLPAALGGLSFLGLAIILVATQFGYKAGWVAAPASQQISVVAFISVGAITAVLFSQNAYAARQTVDAGVATAWDERPWVMWLRSFRDDRVRLRLHLPEMLLRLAAPLLPWGWLEGLVVAHCSALGPVIALGRPDDKTRPSGAFREYLDGEDWQDHLRRRLTGAKAIVHCFDQTPGTVFEYELLISSPELRCRTLFFFHPRLAINVRHRALEMLPGEAVNAGQVTIGFFFDDRDCAVIFDDPRQRFGSYAEVLVEFCASIRLRKVQP